MPGLKSIAKKSAINICKLLEPAPRRNHDAMVTLMHEVGGSPSGMVIAESVFRAQLEYMLEQKVSWYCATELANSLEGVNSSNSVCVTFDDGRLCAFDATRGLLEAGAKCTHFIIPDRVNSRDKETMSWSQIRELNTAGVEIGSHSLTHPYLTRLDKPQLEEELRTSKTILEDKLGTSVTSFAYPYGVYDQRVVEAVVDCGYSCAFTTRHLYTSKASGLFEIPRFEPLESLGHLVEIFQGQGYWFYRLLSNYYRIRDLLRS